MILSGIVCWFWVLPQLAASVRQQSSAEGPASDMAEVSIADLTGALSTTDLPGSAAARLQKDAGGCGEKLAWVTVSRQAGPGSGTLRLRSGAYFSPAFAVTEMPVRIAIPFPAPYESGHGTLTVLGADTGVTVALSPAWHVPPSTGPATRPVTWTPSTACSRK